jgi:uncharacterized protein (TIGR00369 family)
MNGGAAPPIDGSWEQIEVPNTGAWTLGTLWYDRKLSRYCILVLPEHCNLTGAMHGGAMATFLDAQGFAVMDLAADGSDHCPTISLHVDFMAPAKAGDWLVAQVAHLRTTRTMIFTQTTASVGPTVVASSQAIYRNNTGKDAR